MAAIDVEKGPLLTPSAAESSGAESVSIKPPKGYELRVQGLRAVAVLLVLCFHADVPLFPGGFIGVDAFFVVSGFVVTKVLTSEVLDTGTVSISTFYGRRAKRLLPAANIVLWAVLFAGYFVTNVFSYLIWTDSVKWCALFSANFYFYDINSDYFKQNERETESPFLHYWSLAVEEQFYFIWPLLYYFLAVWVQNAFKMQKLVWVILIVVCVGSLFMAIRSQDHMFSFFLLPARAWELLAGAMLELSGLCNNPDFLTSQVHPLVRMPWKELLGLLGLAGLLGGNFYFTKDTVFPGSAALVPVIATVLILLAPETSRSGRWLNNGVLVYLGDRSYSLYLWHWPFVVIGTNTLMSYLIDENKIAAETAESAMFRMMVKVGFTLLSVPVALIFYRFYEDPLRRYKCSSLRSLLAGGAMVGLTVLLAKWAATAAKDKFEKSLGI